MRYVIGMAAFLVPMLIAVAVGATLAGDGAARSAHLDAAALGELRDFVRDHEGLLDRYASAPGSAESGSMPHLALDRFDRHGCNAGGQPWYRLPFDRTGLLCGVIRRGAQPGNANTVGAGQIPTLVVPLTQTWAYWEIVSPTPKSP